MSQFFNDTFTEGVSPTSLTSHTSDSGHSWVFAAGDSSAAPGVYSVAGGIVANGTSALQIYRPSIIAPNADVTVSAATYYDSSSFTTIGVTARMASDASVGYLACYSVLNTRWEIHRIGSALSTTVLANSLSTTYSHGDTPAIDFSVTGSGSSVVLDLKVGGISVASFTDTSGSRVTAAGYTGLWLRTAGPIASGLWFNSMSSDAGASAATAVTLSGPSGGIVGVASTNFTVGANGAITGTVVVTPSDGGAGGTFSPTTVNISSGSPTGTFTYTPAGSGAKTISVTNSGSLTNPSSLTYTASGGAATAVTLSGPTSGVSGAASSNFTVSANGTLSSSLVVTPSDSGGGGTFSPTSVTLSSGTLTGTFTYTPASAGTKSVSITNNGSLTNSGSPISYNALPSSVAVPYPTRVADRVKESSASTSTSTIALAGTSTGFLRFQDAFAVGTKRIPVLYGDANNGANWLIAYCTLASTTSLTIDEIISSSNAGSAPTFSAGAKDVICVMPAKTAFRANSIDLGDYAVYPDFSSDSTAGVQQAILDAYSRKIEKINGLPGRFKIAGPRVGSGNCQIYVPQTREAQPNRSIYIVGPNPPNFEQQGLRNVVPPDNGMLFESTIVGAGSDPSVFGFEQGNAGDTAGWIWNYTNLGLENLGIRTRVSTGANPMSAINGTFAAQMPLLHNLRIDVDMGLVAAPTPSSSSCGIIMPPVNNHLLLNGGMVYISGYYTGVRFGEHTKFDSLIVIGATRGIDLLSANHGSYIGQYSNEHCAYPIYVSGEHPLCIAHYDTEHNNTFTWGTYVRDIHVASGTRPIAIVLSTVVRASSGYDLTAFASNGALHKILAGAGAN